MKRKAYLFTVSVIAALLFTGCGTTVVENTQNYFAQVGNVISDLQKGGEGEQKGAETIDVPKLAAPADFTVDADGNFSFGAVEDADHYLIYMCAPDAVKDEDDFIYSSDAIYDNGNTDCKGNLSDVMDYAYGEYLVKVLAFPALDDTGHDFSQAATASYTITGTMDNPEISYFWNAFTDTMDIQISNIDNYQYEVYPDQVVVTFTNTEDDSDIVKVELKDISLENCSIKTDAVLRGNTYEITAVAESTSEFVNNASSDVVQVEQALALGERNILVDGYSFPEGSNGFARGAGQFPNICESFAPETGGVCGEAIGSAPGGAGDRIELIYTATPTEAAEGAAYSYSIEAPGFFPFTGSMSLYADNSLVMLMDGPAGPVQPTQIEGLWFENEDGTYTLCFNPDSVTVITTGE